MKTQKKFYTSYYGNTFLPKKSDGLLFAISCGVPDYFKDIPKLELFCPKGLLKLTNSDFDIAYSKKLAALDKNAISHLIESLPDGAFLLCFEAPPKPCHRHMVAEYLRGLGFDIDEYELVSTSSLQGRLKVNPYGSGHRNDGSYPSPAASLFDYASIRHT